MALKSTIFKVQINIADLDRHYYDDCSLTIARHPSETDERMMLRVACFALFAHERLEFTRGISTEGEPDLWQKNLSGEIEHWIDLGMPDEKRIRKACGRALKVTVVCYGGTGACIWFDKAKSRLARFNNLQVLNIEAAQSAELGQFAARNMALQITIEDQQVSVSSEQQMLTLLPDRWL
jgi:uncharacterized protein YaeQ